MRFIGPVLFLLLLAACSETPKPADTPASGPKLVTREDSLVHEVLEGHDVGMARMMKISKYQKRITQELDSLLKVPAAKLDKQYQQALVDLQEDLNYAEYSMNAWMSEFKLDSLKNEPAKRLGYLEKEKQKVLAVKEAILGSLSRGDSLFLKK